MTNASDILPTGWLFKVEDHEGTPFARYIAARIPDIDEAAVAVAEAIDEKTVTPVRNLSKSDVEGMQLGEVRPYNL